MSLRGERLATDRLSRNMALPHSFTATTEHLSKRETLALTAQLTFMVELM
jgi:hypothetical protein